MPPIKRRVTLKDIAEATGYTPHTISRALNDKNDISDAAKKMIKEVADQMGYISDGMAGSLRSGKTKTIAVILSDIENPHLAHQVKLIEQYAAQHSYSTIILNTDENSAQEKQAIIAACARRVDGILLCPVQENEDNILFLQSLGIPFVLIGRYFEHIETDMVLCDDIMSGFLATDYLLKKGFHRILFIGAPDYISPGRERLLGYKNAHQKAGVSVDDSLIHAIHVKTGYAKTVIQEMIDKNIEFDSVIAFSDLLGFEVKYALEHSLGQEANNIPVVGFDCVQSHLPLPFSFVSVGMDKQGWAVSAIDLLFARIDCPDGERKKILLDVHLAVYN